MPPKRSEANQALGRAIRATREERGHTQEGFAAHAGFDRSHYGAIERGEFNPSVDTVVKLAAALGISVGALFTRAGL